MALTDTHFLDGFSKHDQVMILTEVFSEHFQFLRHGIHLLRPNPTQQGDLVPEFLRAFAPFVEIV